MLSRTVSKVLATTIATEQRHYSACITVPRCEDRDTSYNIMGDEKRTLAGSALTHSNQKPCQPQHWMDGSFELHKIQSTSLAKNWSEHDFRLSKVRASATSTSFISIIRDRVRVTQPSSLILHFCSPR